MSTVRRVEFPDDWLSVSSNGWRIEALAGSAGDLHAVEVAPERLVRVHLVDAPAVVLGSSQRGAEAGADASGQANGADLIEAVRRRSGGGAVWLEGGIPGGMPGLEGARLVG